MVKRTLMAVGAVGLLSMFCFGRDAVSYVGTSAGWLKQSVKDSVPIEFEIERARKMVKDLVPDIRKNMHVIAQEEVEVEKLDAQIALAEKKLGKDRTELVRLKTDLSNASGTFHYAGRSYSTDQVKTDLSHRFERFKTSDATLASLKEIHSARERSLSAARAKLEGMLAAKRQLEVDVENLEARLKMVEVAQTTSNYSFDDSQLGRAKELISDLRTRLNVAERMITTEGQFSDEIPLDEAAPDDIVDQVSEYLSGDTTKLAENVKATE
jgi:chromosome segregation ATPase